MHVRKAKPASNDESVMETTDNEEITSDDDSGKE
jgi:hypothetical protein